MSKSFFPAKRSEFLFCYDARMANPNGDPDENRPRIDPITHKNLVTEFRLKRTIRDYLERRMGLPVFMKEEIEADGSVKTIEGMANRYIEETTSRKGDKEKKSKTVQREKLTKDHIDIRLFGLLFAVGGVHFKQTGPVQFGIGQSLNQVDEIQVRMTRVVPTKEEAKAGTFGEKHLLRYSFIVFHGFLNDIVAKEVNLTEKDVSSMMQAAWFGTNDLSTTSKFGQASRLLLRVNYAGTTSFIGDLDTHLHLDAKEKDFDLKKVEDISQITLNITSLLNYLDEHKKDVSSIEYAYDEALRCKCEGNEKTFNELLRDWAKNNKIEISDLLQIWGSSN